MKLIEQNPFRVLGISVNASPKDLAANKGKMRLLDIGKEVTFPLDLSGMLHPIVRTKESVAVAERDINLPHDRVRHALFWFAQPDSPMGKLAYDHLLQGMTDSAIEKFNRCPNWEAKLCLATLYLQQGQTIDALCAMEDLLEKHCNEFVQAVAGQTHSEDADALRHDYVMAIAQEVDIAAILAQASDGDLPEAMLTELRSVAVDKPMASIEKAIATAKTVDSKDAAAQLKAGRDLMNSTKDTCQQLAGLVGKNDMHYSRLADKLANQILQCSINYYNNIEGENREIIENALALGEYALTIAVGKMARDHVQHNVDILRKKKADLPPAEVEDEVTNILSALRTFVGQPDKIEHSVSLLNATKPHLQSMKRKLGATDAYYLRLSTQVAGNALHNLIEEVNEAQKPRQETQSMFGVSPSSFGYSGREFESPASRNLLLLRITKAVSDAWRCIEIIDTFDTENDFYNNRYIPNRNTLKGMHDQIVEQVRKMNSTYSKPTSNSDSGGCYIATMVYGDYNHPQVMVLRHFRDDVLQQHSWGRAFVRFYYRNSPGWVERLKDKKGVNRFIKAILDQFIKVYNHE